MAGLAVHNFVSAAAGAAVVVALIRGSSRRRTNTLGNFWVDLVAHDRSHPRPAGDRVHARAREPGCDPELPRLPHRHDGHRPDADDPRWTRSRARRRSRRSARTAAGRYNANSSHPFENPNPITNILEIWMLLAIPFALHVDVREDGRRRETGHRRCSTRDVRALARDLARRDGVRVERQPASSPPPARTRRSPRRSRGGNMEGKETRFGPAASGLFAAATTGTSTGSVDSHARQLHADRRRGPAREHHARRGRPGRHRLRPLRHAAVRAALGVHRRPHGRPNAGVSGQEDPGPRDEARGALHPARAARGPRLHRDLDGDAVGVELAAQHRTARPHRDDVRVHVDGATTTDRRSPGSTETPTGSTSPARSRCWSAASC